MAVSDNLRRVQEQIASACSRAGRAPEDVRLMAVSKVQSVESIVEAYTAGQRLFGENRVQEVQAKQPHLATLPDLELHLIGPLQNNKTTRAAELFHAVDTLDSLKTARRLHDAASALGKTLSVLVEVKLSPEEAKHGLAAEDLRGFLEGLRELPALQVRGLMTVPPWDEDAEKARSYFQQLRDLRDRYKPEVPSLSELSMGMSNDFAVAIEEGSTTVRIGTAIFGRRPTPSDAPEQ